ncbi:hypothetical protein [Sinorhizobium meliloti]|uniref:hypothetical protein n=1 Tax=Rhizobium meliloti TaxID=382 RepID=UPI000FE087F3|nr:hypothetical protein [Sinorhizobium meliloti]RVO54967.1 hypothetical protein CN094_25785 [Sinorhizobium meliloti]
MDEATNILWRGDTHNLRRRQVFSQREGHRLRGSTTYGDQAGAMTLLPLNRPFRLLDEMTRNLVSDYGIDLPRQKHANCHGGGIP